MNGIGTWGNNIPVAWGWAIVNFVFWVGIGHAGTLISAILFLFRQRWRTGIARFAEAMTVFAVICAMQFPLLHTGRPWLAMFWLIPYPNDQGIYQNFRSPLEWDVFAVSTYGLVSVMFWFTGLIPDLATARDRAKHPFRKFVYGLLSLGWKGSNRAWGHYEKAYLLFAGLSTPLVLSVHSIVSFDFAVSVIPGWHTTIFPPYFVAGAIFSGFAMVATLIIILRKMFRLQHLITDNHLELMNKIIIATSMMVGYCVRDGVFHGVVQRRGVRAIRLHEPGDGALCMGLLDHGDLQRAGSPVAVVQEDSPVGVADVPGRDSGERRHVVRAICHRGDQPAS